MTVSFVGGTLFGIVLTFVLQLCAVVYIIKRMDK